MSKKITLFFEKNNNMMAEHHVYHHELKKNYEGKGRLTELIKTNSYGLITLPDVKPNFSDYKNNYVFLGDSFTQGAGIQYNKSYSGILTEKLSSENINIINLSAISYSPSIYFSKTKFFIENYDLKFSKLFLFLDISDPYDELYRYEYKNQRVISRTNKDTFFQKQKPYFMQLIKKFVKNNTTVTKFILVNLNNLIFKNKEEIDFFQQYGFYINHQANLWTYDKNYFNEEGYKGIELSKKYLIELKKILEKQEAELTLIVYPWPGQIYRNDKNFMQVNIWNNWAKKNKINFVDLSPIFFKGDLSSEDKRLKIIDKYYFSGDMHFNEQGHKLIADHLLKVIK